MDRIIAARVFVAINERGSLIAAANALDMSRAMVTRYLAQIEQWAGARLLHRTTRRLGLTTAGEITLARCRQILEIADAIPAVGDSQRNLPRGKLRIACSQPLAQSMLAAAITAYLLRYPNTSVDLQIRNETVDLIAERIDLAVRITNQLEPGVIARKLGVCESVVCAAPVYLQRRGIPKHVEELELHNCLTYTFFGKSFWSFEKSGESFKIPVKGNLSGDDALVLLQAAVAGAGIVLSPMMSAAPMIASGQLVVMLPEYCPEVMSIYGIYASRSRLSATLRTMLDFLVDWLATSRGELMVLHN